MRDLVVRLRRQLKPKAAKLHVEGISDGSQPFVLWGDRQLARLHRSYSGEVFADFKKMADQLKGADAGLSQLFATNETEAASKPRLRGRWSVSVRSFPTPSSSPTALRTSTQTPQARAGRSRPAFISCRVISATTGRCAT